MSSQATKLLNALKTEEARSFPDTDIIYAIKQRLPYANTVDTDKLHKGSRKLDKLLTDTEN